MTEKQLQSKFLSQLSSMNIYHIKTIVCSRSGIPDCIACIEGRFVAFEFKSSIGILSPLQKVNKSNIECCGGKFFVVTPENYKNIIVIIEGICQCQ